MAAVHASLLQGHQDKQSTTFLASDHTTDGKKHLLLGASGSVATIKLPKIAEAFAQRQDLSIRIVLTKAAKNFLAGQSHEQPSLDYLRTLPNVDGVFLDDDEWAEAWTRGSAILHIELRRWADLLVIAPLSANSLAKVTAGISDNLLLSIIRAWDTTGVAENSSKVVKRIIVAPAMNTAMWLHPITRKHIKILREEWGIEGRPEGWIEVLKPIEKTLACGDAGTGAMAEWIDIVSLIGERLALG
ncbi:MAG: hypothetical protein LQ352_000791 [Teloschistes flavicans]|nr:MAG: hypothetical protein LQ352_000791 [Teloschistes flavicans]